MTNVDMSHSTFGTIYSPDNGVGCEKSLKNNNKPGNVFAIADSAHLKDDVEYDDLLSAAGEFGRYQILLFFSAFPFYLFGVFVYFTQPFLTEVSPNHWCWIPELENLTDIERRTLAIPPDLNAPFGYSRCRSYIANWSEVLFSGPSPNTTWVTGPCQHGWEFNKTEIPYPTTSSEMEWVCNKDTYETTALAIFYIGSVFGGLIFGWVADSFGRIPAAVISNIVGCVGGIATTFASNLIEFSICRFFVGMSSDSCMMMVYLLTLEYVAPKYRTHMANLSFALFYAPSVTLLPWLALTCGHWKIISLVTSLPLAFALFTPLVIPESPRWVLSKGRVESAIEKVKKIADVNKRVIPPQLIDNFRVSISKKKKEESRTILELLKRPVLRRTFIFTCLIFVSCTVVFDALVRSIGQLDFDFFISYSILSATELPALLLTAFILDYLGRRWLTAIVMFICSVFCLLTVFIGGGLPSVLCAMVTRFAANIGYGTVIQWAAEVIPTSVRGCGVSMIYVLSDVVTILSPYILYLETYFHWLPLVIVGSMAGVCAICALALPETTNKELPQTFDDMEDLAKNQRTFEFPFMQFRKTDVAVQEKS